MGRQRQRQNRQAWQTGKPIGHVYDDGCSREIVNRIRSKCHALIATTIKQTHKKQEDYITDLLKIIGDTYVWAGPQDILRMNGIPFAPHPRGYAIDQSYFEILRQVVGAFAPI